MLILPREVNLPTVGQPAMAGCAGRYDQFPQVYLPPAGEPGAMQGLIRLGGSNIEAPCCNS